ncbi:MAG: NAD-dependent epimerase/dehydratase family protein [Candidatus Omnitrophica bacterium]|nr:NAD-dependent epimerase/dehydratase family protein [Candidatus Omnitrophota bacterium]
MTAVRPRRQAAEPSLHSAFAGRKVIITGGLGFIGSTLAHRLVGLGATVLVVDSLIPEYGGNLFNLRGIESRVTVNIADVRDVYSLRHLVRGQDYLFNLAGQTSHLDSMSDPYTDLEINCRAQLSILETCRKHNARVKIVYASTRQVYGVPDYLPVDERHLVRPVDVNGINKAAGEWYHIVYNNVYGIRACALRLTNTYGPRMRVRDARQTFLGWWIRQLIEGQPIQVYGDGAQRRDFAYVGDVVEACLIAATHEACNGRIFNVGGDSPVSLKDLARLLVDIYGRGSYRVVPFPPDRKAIDIGDYYADDRLFRTHFPWRHTTSLRQGLTKTLAYYEAYGPAYYWNGEEGSAGPRPHARRRLAASSR